MAEDTARKPESLTANIFSLFSDGYACDNAKDGDSSEKLPLDAILLLNTQDPEIQLKLKMLSDTGISNGAMVLNNILNKDDDDDEDDEKDDDDDDGDEDDIMGIAGAVPNDSDDSEYASQDDDDRPYLSSDDDDLPGEAGALRAFEVGTSYQAIFGGQEAQAGYADVVNGNPAVEATVKLDPLYYGEYIDPDAAPKYMKAAPLVDENIVYGKAKNLKLTF